jgi:hypothetical protein
VKCESAPRGAPEILASQRQDQISTIGLLARLALLEAELANLRAEVRCRRCAEPAPPLARWGGDPLARDYRPAHSCGRDPWSR